MPLKPQLEHKQMLILYTWVVWHKYPVKKIWGCFTWLSAKNRNRIHAAIYNFSKVVVRKHLSDGKTSQSHPFPPLQLSLVTVETATLKARFDDTHSFTWRRSVDWYIYIMYIHGSYRSVLKFNKVTLWGLRIRGCWWSTRTFSSFEASVLIALSWECGCQSVNWTITLVTFPAPFSTSQFLLPLSLTPLSSVALTSQGRQ